MFVGKRVAQCSNETYKRTHPGHPTLSENTKLMREPLRNVRNVAISQCALCIVWFAAALPF